PAPDQFKIVVTAEPTRSDEPFKLHFRDSGIGVEERHKDRIFEEGFRTPKARNHDARGLGLGLTICRRLARDFGGDVTLGGLQYPTDFVLSIPRSLAKKSSEGR